MRPQRPERIRVRNLLDHTNGIDAATWIADKRDAIVDPEFCAVYLEYDAAFDWSPDDPRLSALAERTQRWIANRLGRFDGGERPNRLGMFDGAQSPNQVHGPAIARLVATSFAGSSPAWDRLAEIARQRRVARATATRRSSLAWAPERMQELHEHG